MAHSTLMEEHYRLTERLLNPGCYPHPAKDIQRLETHISTLLLAGESVYKLKKPLDLGFLDFTTLAQRRACCREELRLNGRFAPELYLGMSAITGTRNAPRVDGTGEVLDFAVRMRRFPQENRLDQALTRGDVRPDHLDRLADDIAAFHLSPQTGGTPPPAADTVDGLLEPVLENLTALSDLLDGSESRARLAQLARWTHERADVLRPLIAERLRHGKVRECHGDLHLENIVLLNSRPVPFDGIEFSAALRWIDCMNELAFLCMDLVHRGRSDCASRLLSRYLDATGDHAGVPLLRFYQVYRALVRAKIQALRLKEDNVSAAEAVRVAGARDHYLELALQLTSPPSPTLTVTCGLAGSGKSTAALALVERTGAIRLRSDVERKRLQGLEATARTGSTVAGGIYGEAASKATYQRLAELADTLLKADWPVVVDAACLRRAQRDQLRAVATRRRCPFQLLYCDAPLNVLRQRIRQRAEAGLDPSDADTSVLDHQLTRFQPPEDEEQEFLLPTDTGHC